MKKAIVIILTLAIIAFLVCGGFYVFHKYQEYKEDTTEEAGGADTSTLSENGLVSANEAVSENSTDDAANNASNQRELESSDPLYALKQSLVVDIDRYTLEKMYVDQLVEFADNSMPNRRVERNNAASKVGWDGTTMMDAVTFPFSLVSKDKKKYTKEDAEAMVKELEQEDETNPVFLDMELQAAKYLEMTDGTNPYDYNADWIDPYLEAYEQYGPGAFVQYHTVYWQKYGFELPTAEEEADWIEAHPGATIPTDTDQQLILGDDGTPKLFTSQFHQNTAKRWKTLRAGLTLIGVETHPTSNFWYLNDAMNANKVRTVHNQDKDYIDDYPALMYAGEHKDKGRQFLFGYNIYDKRIIIPERTSENVVQEKVVHKKKPTPTPTPTPIPDPVVTTSIIPITPNPVTPVIPDPEPIIIPDPEYHKDDMQGSVQQGNAQKGGGEGQGATPEQPVTDPSLNDMQDANQGQDTNQGHSNPETVLPETPSGNTGGDTGNSGGNSGGESKPKDDENKMNYGDEPAAKDNGNTTEGDVTDDEAGGEFEM